MEARKDIADAMMESLYKPTWLGINEYSLFINAVDDWPSEEGQDA